MEKLQITTHQMAENSNYSIQDVQRILHDRRAPFPKLVEYLEKRMEFEQENPWPRQTNAQRYAGQKK